MPLGGMGGGGMMRHGAAAVSGGVGCAGPVLGFFLVLLIIFVIWLLWRKKAGGRPSIAVDTVAQGKGIGALRERDPQFNPVAFIERTKQTVERVNAAWLAGDMRPVRCLISDGNFARLRTQLALLERDGLRNVMLDWRVVSCTILAAVADEVYDTIHMRVIGEARDVDVPREAPPAEAERLGRQAPLSEYQEVWSFLRRRGRETKPGVFAAAGRCPNCGADLPRSEVVKCEFCSALINSGEHDWVLAEITQAEEWDLGVEAADLAGLEEIRRRDPGVSRQGLEDRAAIIFWKWIEARATDDLNKLNRYVSSALPREQWPEKLLAEPASLSRVALGSAEISQLSPAADESGWDRLQVELRWSAAQAKQEAIGAVHTFHLARAAAAGSSSGLSSLDCSNCGGSMSHTDDPACEYCGAALSSGTRDWVLEAISA